MWNSSEQAEYRAKALRKDLIPKSKRELLVELHRYYPEQVTQEDYRAVAKCVRDGKYTGQCANIARQGVERIEGLLARAEEAELEAERLRPPPPPPDTRPYLDPADEIPPGPYKKFRDCAEFPLRRNCDYGENATHRWFRCRYMEFNRTKTIADVDRWQCTAPRAT